MAAATDINIIRAVNQRIDPEQLMRLIGWRTEKMRRVGPSLHCCCPLHQGDYSTLIIDLRRKEFLCTYRNCVQGQRGGDLVGLWAATQNLETVHAALDLCERLGLALENGAQEWLSHYLFDGAETAFVKRNLDEARVLALRARELDPDKLNVQVLLASILFHQGETSEAAELLSQVADAWLRRGDRGQAVAMLERILEQEPDNMAVRRRLGQIHADGDEESMALQIYRENCQINERLGREADNIEWYEKSLLINPGQMDARRRLSELLIQRGALEAGLAQLFLLAEQQRAMGDRDGFAQTLDTILRLEPEDSAGRLAMARTALEMGDTQSARRLYEAVERESLTVRAFDQALLCQKQLLRLNPDNLEVRLRLARTSESAGQIDKARELYQHVVDRALDDGNITLAMEVLERLVVELGEKDPDVRLALADCYARCDRTSDAIYEYQLAADRLRKAGREEDADRVDSVIARLAPDQTDHLLRLAVRYAQQGQLDDAIAQYLAVARQAGERDQAATRLRAAEEGLKLAPDSLELMELRLQAWDVMGDRDRRLAGLRQIIHLYMSREMMDQAQAAMAEALREAPEDEDLRRAQFALLGRLGDEASLGRAIEAYARECVERHKTQALVGMCRSLLSTVAEDSPVAELLTDLCAEHGVGDIRQEALHAQVERLLRGGKYAEARQTLETLLALDPQDEKALSWLAKVIHKSESFAVAAPFYLAAIDRRKGHAPESAIRQAYSKIQEYDPRDTRVRQAHAEYLERIGDWDAACKQLLVLSEDLLETALDEVGAVAVLERICDHDPLDLPTHCRLAALCHRRGDTSRAVLTLQDLAERLAARDDDESALEVYLEILAMDPINRPAHEGLVGVYLRNGENELALERCLFLADLHREDADRLEGLRRALPWLDQALSLQPFHREAMVRAARACRDLGLKEQALERYRQLVATAPPDEVPALTIEACSYIAIHDPEDLDMGEKLAGCLEQQGRLKEAKAEYQRLSDLCLSRRDMVRVEGLVLRLNMLDSSDPVSAELLGRVYEDKGDRSGACAEYLRACASFRKAGQETGTIALLLRVKRMAPDRLDVRRHLIAACMVAGENGRAAVECGELCRLALDGGDSALAFQTLEQLRELAPDARGLRMSCVQLLHDRGHALQAREELIRMFEQYEGQERWEQALEICQTAGDLFADDSGFTTRRLALLKRLGRQEEALADLKRLAEEQRRAGDLEGASQTLAEVLEMAPEDIRCLSDLADLRLQQDRREDGAYLLRRLVEACRADGDLDQALACQARMVDLAPRSIEERRSLIALCEQAGKTSAAMEERLRLAELLEALGLEAELDAVLEEMLETAPDHARALGLLVASCVRQGDHRRAVDALLLQGDYLEKTGDLAQAEERTMAAIELLPDSLAAHQRLAELFARLGKGPLAAEEWAVCARLVERQGGAATGEGDDRPAASFYWTQAALYDPDVLEYHAGKAYALEREGAPGAAVTELLLMARLNFDGKNYPIALEYARRAQAICQKNGIADGVVRARELLMEIYIDQNDTVRAGDEIQWLCDQAMARHDHGAAEALVRRGLELEPESAPLWLRYGDIHEQLQRKGQAVKALTRAMTLYSAMGDYDKRDDLVARILDLDPSNKDILKSVVAVLFRKGQTDKAIARCFELAEYNMECGRLVHAEGNYRQIVSCQSDNERAWLRLIQIHIQLESPKDLISDYIALGEIYIKQSRIYDAVQMLRKALDNDPDNISLWLRHIELRRQVAPETDLVPDYLQLAAAYERIEQTQEARRWYKRALALDPSNQAALDFVKQGLSSSTGVGPARRPEPPIAPDTKDIAEIIQNYNRILRINPSNTTIRIQLAELYDAGGREDDACQHWFEAGETLIQSGDINRGIEVLEQLLRRRPSDARVRAHLNKAVLKRDAFSAIDSLFD